MGKYISNFATTAEFEAAESSLITPHVSLTRDNMNVHYLPFVDPSGGHPYVEIGGIKWATMNIGATSETDYGNYYQYGKGADQYAATSGDSIYSGNEDPLATSADTVAQTWGGNWRMPTYAEFESLTANTNYTWETNYNGSGVNGGLFTSKTDSSKKLFFPAEGYYNNGSLKTVGSYGDVWSSNPVGSINAYNLLFDSGHKGMNYSNRGFGYSVRGVLVA